MLNFFELLNLVYHFKWGKGSKFEERWEIHIIIWGLRWLILVEFLELRELSIWSCSSTDESLHFSILNTAQRPKVHWQQPLCCGFKTCTRLFTISVFVPYMTLVVHICIQHKQNCAKHVHSHYSWRNRPLSEIIAPSNWEAGYISSCAQNDVIHCNDDVTELNIFSLYVLSNINRKKNKKHKTSSQGLILKTLLRTKYGKMRFRWQQELCTPPPPRKMEPFCNLWIFCAQNFVSSGMQVKKKNLAKQDETDPCWLWWSVLVSEEVHLVAFVR